MEILILDASAACHMPDVLEMPYRPPLRVGTNREKNIYVPVIQHDLSCRDVIGDYSFEHPVAIGDRLVFEDMAIYSMVKIIPLTGMPLPGIACEEMEREMIRPSGMRILKRDCHNITEYPERSSDSSESI